MAAAFLRFMTMVALLFMPLSMASAPAAASPSASTSSTGHCDEHQKPAEAPTVPKAHCAVCAALPVGDATVTIAELRPALLLEVEVERWIAEREPDIDTPPPKLG
jgi:hypothetical protein